MHICSEVSHVGQAQPEPQTNSTEADGYQLHSGQEFG